LPRGSRLPVLALAAVVLLAVFLQSVFFVGVMPYDSSGYALRCVRIADGTFALDAKNRLYVTRPLLLFPCGLAFRLLGPSDFSAGLYPMLCSLGTVVLTYLIGRRLFGNAAAALAASLLALCPQYVVFSTTLMPDVPLAFYMTLSVYLFLLGDSSASARRWVFFAAAGLLLGAAWLVRENGVVLLLFYCLFLVVYRKRVSWAHALVFVFAAVVFLIETIAYGVATGDCLYRVGSLLGGAPGGGPVLGASRTSLWLFPWNMFVGINECGLLFYLLVGAVVYALITKRRELWLVAMWFGVLYLYTHFGTWSIRTWRTGAQNMRYLMPALVPACLLVAAWLTTGVRAWRRWLYGTILTAVVASSIVFTFTTYVMELSGRNGPKWAWYWLRNQKPAPVYAGRSPSYVMSFYAAVCPKAGFDILPYEDYWTYPVDLSSVSDCYVVIESRTVDAIRLEGGVSPPKEIRNPPTSWTIVAIGECGPPGLSGFALNALLATLELEVWPEDLRANKLADIKAGMAPSRVTVYYVPPLSGR
jgi:4-amino-4-deoxy-L-arabinose transferase-like glycosyltransferase